MIIAEQQNCYTIPLINLWNGLNAIKQYQNVRFCPRRSLKLRYSYVTDFNYYNDNLKLKLHTKDNNELFGFQEVNYCSDVYAAIVHSIKLMMFSFQHNKGNDAEK